MGTWRITQKDAIKTLLENIKDGSNNRLISYVIEYPTNNITGYPAVVIRDGSMEVETHSNKSVSVIRTYYLDLYVERSEGGFSDSKAERVKREIIDEIVTKMQGNLALASGVHWTEVEHGDTEYTGTKTNIIKVTFTLKVYTVDATASAT